MKLVMTLLCRDSADTIDAHLAFHLNAGVDFVIATDHRSEDGTTEILEQHEREGHVHLIREAADDFRQSAWVTRMARLAASDYGADWVVNSDSDEFWWPRGANLKEVLAALPPRYGLVRGYWRTFPPRPDDGRFFAERMTLRLAPVAPVNDPTTPWRPNTKVIHRADPAVIVRKGNHMVDGVPFQPLRGWSPVEVLHFPFRSGSHVARKATYRSQASMHHAHELSVIAVGRGELSDRYRTFVVDDLTAAQGLADGLLVEDTRLRDILRTLAGTGEVSADSTTRRFAAAGSAPVRFPRPGVVDDVAFAIDAAVYTEAELVRAQRQLDDLEQRVAALEGSLGSQLARGLRRVVGRGGEEKS
jgi:Glycosyl transferase family 2